MGRWISYNFECKTCNKTFNTLVDLSEPGILPPCPFEEPIFDGTATYVPEHEVKQIVNAFGTYDIRGEKSNKTREFMK